MIFLENFRCPITKNGVDLINRLDFNRYNVPSDIDKFGELKEGLIDSSENYFYPIFNDIALLHEQYALHVGSAKDLKKDLSFDKKRVFDYYNDIDYKIKDSFKIYEDSPKWVDFREVSSHYIKKSFTRASKFFPSTGQFILDIASGPIGVQEYIDLSEGYDYRICIDISINALIGAKKNLETVGKKGVYICGDITKIPLADNCCDTVLSQHTLYHLPKNDQFTATNEMYRVAKDGSKIVIIYSLFYHSWMMNLTLNVVQVYRILRHFAGKLYVRLFKSKPRLYFYPHSPRWFKTSFQFSKDIEFFCWRSTNKYFLDLYIHPRLGGKFLLSKLAYIEDKYSKFMSTFGEYPAIVITKRKKDK